MSLELAEEGTKFTGQAWSGPVFSFIYPYNNHASRLSCKVSWDLLTLNPCLFAQIANVYSAWGRDANADVVRTCHLFYFCLIHSLFAVPTMLCE